ncbi:MAG: hypothetical protein KDI09_18790 [Halioglobus sp.]|nr:hypothetical protein [Halioglobus sp.]
MADKNNNKSSRSPDLTLAGFGLRFLAALVLVMATYNPSRFSVYAWIRDALGASALGPVHLFVLVLLLIGWTVYLVASFRSLGTLGMVLGALFFAALVWLLTDFGLLAADSVTSLTWIILVCLAALLTIGVSGSHIWRRLTGQLEVDDD